MTFTPWNKRFAKTKDDELKKFLKRAFEHEYLAGMTEPEEEDGAHEAIVVADSLDSFEYQHGDWAYLHERSTGGYPTLGTIFVTYMGAVRWMMTYSAQVIQRVNRDDLAATLDEALEHVDLGQPIRGPKKITTKTGLSYHNDFRGVISQFEGDEYVRRDDAMVYKLHYMGGYVNLK